MSERWEAARRLLGELVSGPSHLDAYNGHPSGVYLVQHRPSGLVKLGSSDDALGRVRRLCRVPGVEGPLRVLWTGGDALGELRGLWPGTDPHLLCEGLLLWATWECRCDGAARELALPHPSEWRRPEADVVALARTGRPVVGGL